MGNRVLACALAVAVGVTVAGETLTTQTAQAAPGGVTVVATSDSEWFGDLHWHAGTVYTVGTNSELLTYPADGSAPGAPATTTPLPAAWHTDGFFQSDTDAFVVAPDGSVYLRSPNADHNGGGGVPTPWAGGSGSSRPTAR